MSETAKYMIFWLILLALTSIAWAVQIYTQKNKQPEVIKKPHPQCVVQTYKDYWMHYEWTVRVK